MVIAGVIALVIGGPIAWVVFAAALIVLADAVAKYAQGKASLLDVGLAALSCIPCVKGLTSLAELSDAFKAGGLFGAGSHLLVSGKNAAIGFVRTAQRLRQGLVPAVTAIFTGLSDAADAAEGSSGLTRLTAFYGKLHVAGSVAMRTAWAKYLADLGETDPAKAARMWQAHGSYPGADDWYGETLKAGTTLEAAFPGPSGYVVPDGTFEAIGGDAAAYNAGVQVGPSADPDFAPYRPAAVRLLLTDDLDVASSAARANPQYGPGGLSQHYIPDFHAKVVSGDIQFLDGAGNPVSVEMDPRSGFPDYTTLGDDVPIPLSHFDTMPPVPSIQAVAASRPVIHQTIPRVVGSSWTAVDEPSSR